MDNDKREWAYIPQALLAAPEYDRIERDAIELLGRAINSRPVIAFVGAGASMAYGRISWGDTVLAMQRRVLDWADRAKDDDPTEQTKWKQPRDLLESIKVEPGSALEPRDFLVIFQLAEELWRLLPKRVGNDLKRDFRQQVVELLKDDHGHAEQIINYALRERPDGTLNSRIDRMLLRIEQPPDPKQDYRRLGYLETVFKAVRPRVAKDPKALHILKTLRGSWTEPRRKPDEHQYVRPYHRFLIGVMLRLLPHGQRRAFIPEAYWNPIEPARSELIPADRDPLHLLFRCRINRFLTTNYDQEIERLFRSEGLSQGNQQTDDDTTHHQLGRYWGNLVFDQDHVGHLLAFAARDGRKLAEVVYLHGRADETHEITVTTADYQKRYITADDRRPGMEDALSAAFGGNPVIFVGSGMGEDDLLRPLRQFVGETGLNPDRLSVAFLPAQHDKTRLHLDKIKSLQRYGVYTIHYGSAKVADSKEPDSRWLAKLHQLRKTLDTVLDAAAKLLAGQEKQDGIDAAATPPEDPEKKSRHTDPSKSPAAAAKFPTPEILQASTEITKQIGNIQNILDVTKHPTELECIDISRHPALGIKTELVIVALCVKLAEEIAATEPFNLADWKDHGGESLLRRIGCLQFALAGAMDSITGSFLCATLIKLDIDARAWGGRWLQLPQPLDPAKNVREWIDQRRHAGDTSRLLWRRHAVYLAEDPGDTSGDNREAYRFYSDAPSQTFNHLRASLDGPEVKAILASPPRARRIFLFATQRGVGKGHYFAALTNRKHLEELCLTIGQPTNGLEWPAAFFNFSFSHETSSIFDQITEFLLCAAKRILEDMKANAKKRPLGAIRTTRSHERLEKELEQIRADADNLASDRLGRLELVLRSLADKTTLLSGDRRILVALSGLSMLFDRQGEPKNAQAGRLINLLIGEASRKTPLDLIIFANEQWMPKAFRCIADDERKKDEVFINLVEIKRQYSFPKRERALEHRRAVLRIQPASMLLEDTSPPDQAFVHFLYGTRASVMIAAFFPSVALAIGLHVGLKDWNLAALQPSPVVRGSDLNTRYGGIKKEQFSEHADFLARQKINELLKSGYNTSISGQIDDPKKYFPRIIAFAGRASALGGFWYHKFDGKWRASKDHQPEEPISESRKIAERIDLWFRDLYIACGESRFAFTVLTATAYQHLLPVAVQTQTDQNITPQKIAEAIDTCVGFLKKARFELDGRPVPDRRSATVIDIALKTIAELDANVNRGLPGNLSFLTSGPGLSQLQEVILWQLAVIGQPVTRDVLVHSPLIVQCCKVHRSDWMSRTPKPCPWPESVFVDQAIGDCLRLLEQRCLVFRLRPRVPAAETTPVDPKYRYAVHRFVQRHVFVNLRAPFIEYNEADQFAITLFASQPKDVPRLTPHAYQDLRRTVAALIGFPDVGNFSDDLACWQGLRRQPTNHDEGNTYAETPRTTIQRQAEMLRAALGMVRSIFSLAIINRTDLPPGHGIGGNSSRGSTAVTVLEELRLLLLWMLHQAKTMDKRIESVEEPAGSMPVQRPFYAEEIAWLYNECGVISLTQGRIIDAGHLFERADKAAERFEPEPDGSTRTRIALNKALADIYRGRLQEAQDALTRVQNLADEHPAVLCIARGLLGQVDHIRGRYTSAEAHYKWALEDGQNGHKGLITLDKSRAASIFCRYYGDLLRARDRFNDAEAMLRQAMILAIEGGHEDVRHQARLAALHLEIVRNEKDPEPKKLLDGSRLHRELDVIEEYAISMGMLQLRCATDLIRSDLHRYGGDLKGAASVASSGLTLAETHDMRLRKTRFLLRLADIYERQGQPDQCRPLVEAAFDLARETGYHAAREQGQKLYARIPGGRRATL